MPNYEASNPYFPEPELTRSERIANRIDKFLFSSRPRRLTSEAVGAVALVVPVGVGIKFMEWAQVATDDETRMIFGFTGVGAAAFAAAGIYGCIKLMREEFTNSGQQGPDTVE